MNLVEMSEHQVQQIELPQHVRCSVCGVDDAVPLFRPKKSCGPVVQCRRCDLVYVNPRESAPWLEQLPTEDDDRIHQVWQREWFCRYVEESAWKQMNFRRTLAHLQALGTQAADGRPLRVLDFGCAIGLFLQVASEAGWEAHGVEPDTAVARYAQQVSGLNVFNGLLAEAGFPDEFFDVAVSFQVFEHLPNPADEMCQIARVLRPGGVVAVDVPSIDNIWYRILRGHHRHFATPQHLYFYTPATMGCLLKQAGFEVVDLDFPPRSLSLKHLCKHHVALYSQRGSDWLLGLVERLGWSDRTLSVSLKDVMCVYGRKRIET